MSHNFKTDRIHIDEVDQLEIGGWPLYLTKIHFKCQTKIGQKISFAARQGIVGIIVDVKDVLTRIQHNINKPKNISRHHK